jgi:hypothetical protein
MCVRSPISAPRFAGPLASGHFQQSAACTCVLPASSCLVRVSPTPHTCLISSSPPALTCLTYSSSSSLSAAFRLVTGPRPKPPSGADILPGGGRAACPVAPPTSLCRAFSCEGGNGSSLSVSVSEPTAPAPLSAFFPPPAAAPAAGFSALRSRSAARALQGVHTPHVTLPYMRVSARDCARACDCAGSMYVCMPSAPYVCFAPSIAAACA